MSSCNRDLLDGDEVDIIENNHMSLVPSHRPSLYRGMSLPIRVRQKSINSQGSGTRSIRASLPQEEHEDDDDEFLRPCLPRFSNAVITCKEDMESQLEEFRNRLTIGQSSFSSFYAMMEELPEGEHEESSRFCIDPSCDRKRAPHITNVVS